MKLVYKDMEHVLRFDGGYVNELAVENKKLFFDMVSDTAMQADGARGSWVLSISDKPVEFSKCADVTVQFAPFQINRKSLLTKLYASLEQKAMLAENYRETGDLLSKIERYIFQLAEDLPFEIDCAKLSVGTIIKAIAPEIEEREKDVLEKVFSYMELVRELDKDRLFIMINMRTYFSDEEMERFIESVCLHDFKLLLLESSSLSVLKNTKRYTVDSDLCEF